MKKERERSNWYHAYYFCIMILILIYLLAASLLEWIQTKIKRRKDELAQLDQTFRINKM